MKKDLVMYWRPIKNENGHGHVLGFANETVLPKGGVTIVGRIEENKIHWGVARCCPTDSFSRKLGRQRATGLSYSQKKVITENYDYPLAKFLAEVFVKMGNGYLQQLNVDEYVKIFNENPNVVIDSTFPIITK